MPLQRGIAFSKSFLLSYRRKPVSSIIKFYVLGVLLHHFIRAFSGINDRFF